MSANKKGQAYLFILIVMMSVFIMLSLALYISGYEAQVSSAFHADSNLYLLAVSGAEEGAALINETALETHNQLVAEAVEVLLRKELLQHTEYRLDSPALPYEGYFHLKEEDKNGLVGESDILFQGLYGQLATAYIQSRFDEFLSKKGAAYDFSFEAGDYQVFVEITPESSSFVIDSRAVSETGAALVRAQVSCDFGGHSEVLIPGYTWKTPAAWSEYALYQGVTLPNREVDFLETNWSLEQPFVFTTGNASFDVSNFYDNINGEPVYTALYSKGNLTLEASDPTRSDFKGVAAAQGDIILGEIQVQGSILAGGSIIDDSYSHHQAEPEAVFKIFGENKIPERVFYDLLGITDFGGAREVHSTGSRLSNILNFITFSKNSKVHIQNPEGALFKITGLKEIRR